MTLQKIRLTPLEIFWSIRILYMLADNECFLGKVLKTKKTPKGIKIWLEGIEKPRFIKDNDSVLFISPKPRIEKII